MPQPGSCSNICHSALIALGSNVTLTAGGPRSCLSDALRRLTCDSLTINEVSRFFSTPAFPKGSGPDFVNAAARLETTLTPEALLTHLHAVEDMLGRVRKIRWGARTIDLDLIAYGQRIQPDLETFGMWRDMPLEQQMTRAPEELILPHPRLQDRGFVLGPLRDIAPDWRHPVLGQTVTQMFDALPAAERAALKPIPAQN